MYMIYADGEPLYVPNLSTEGFGVISPKVTMELNKAGSLEFSLPPVNILYNELKKLKSVITVYRDDEQLFEGRVLHDEKDFYNQKQVYCEGALAYLLDSIQRPYSINKSADEAFKKYIENHNKYVEEGKHFQLGDYSYLQGYNVTCTTNTYPNTHDEIDAQIVKTAGGYMSIRYENGKRYIDYLTSEMNENNTCSQIIEFGINLLDITEHITAENIFTVLIPLGATVEDEEGNSTEEKLTIKGVNGGLDYIEDPEAIALFGRIESKEEWSEVKKAGELLTLGRDHLSKNVKMAISLTLKAVDLHLLNVDVEAIHLGNWVRVISLPHGLDEYFQCTKITLDLENPDQDEYTFGFNRTTLTEQQASNKKQMTSSVSTVISAAGAVNSSVSKANQALADVDYVVSQLPSDYVSTSTLNAYKEEVNEDLEQLQADYDDLLARVKALEGGLV